MVIFTVWLSYRRPFGTEQEYFVQLFLEYDGSMKLPTVGELLTKMFKEQKISFTEVLWLTFVCMHVFPK